MMVKETGCQESANHSQNLDLQNATDNIDKKQESSKNKVAYYQLFTFADATDYMLMILGTVGAAGNGLCMPLMTLIFGDVINAFGDNADGNYLVHQVSKVCLRFVYLALGASVAAFLQVACWMVTGERQAARIRRLYLKTMLRQEIGFFDKEINTGEIVGRMSGDTVLIQDAIGENVGKFLQQIATFIAGFVIAFTRGWKLTLVMLSSLPLLILSGAAVALIISKLASRGQTAYSLASTVVEQTIGSIRTVASFTGERQAVNSYNSSLIKAYKSGVNEGLAAGLGFGVVSFVVYSTYGLAIWFGAKMVSNEGYKGGDVMNIIFAVLTGSMSLGQASPCLSAFAAGQAAAFKMFETIDRKPQIDVYETSGRILDGIQGAIELKDIYFSYPARPQERIFNGFCLSVPSGTTAALVGESGSGKSTVISLIERFYDPQDGEVLIDGINLKDFQLKWFRQKISLVSQEPVLFTCSIKDNIAYGKDGATADEIKAAAELANAAKFIDKLPQGIETMVGERGTQLSGGQKQRIAIARAILKDPRILLLDEATSALDTESERVLQEALDRVMVNRTTVIVAHRLSTVRNADTIAVLRHGKIVQKGSHSDLTKDPEGAYSQLIKLQEINSASKSNVNIGDDKAEITVDSGRQSSQRFSLLRSLSRESSGIGNSSRHSFSLPFGVPTGIEPPETAPEKPHTLSSASSKQSAEVPLYRLAYLNKPEIPVLLLGTASAVACAILLPVFGVVVSRMIKTLFEPPNKLQKDARIWALVFFGIGLISMLMNPLRSYFFAVAGCKLINRIRSMCFEKVVYMEISWFDDVEHSSGAIGARLSVDAASVRSLVGDALGLLVQNMATAAAGMVIAFEANWELSLIVIILLPLLGVNSYVQMKSIKGFSRDTQKMYEEASQIANDAVGNIRTVASFCAEEKVMELYENKCEGPLRKGMREGLISGIGYGISFFTLFSVYAISFYAGARLVEAGDASFDDVFQVFFALTLAAIGISQSGSLVPDATKAKTATASIFPILERKSKIDSSEGSGTTIENLKGEIEFLHVSFRYPTRPGVEIFRDLSLYIQHGKTVALVGESGCGKSTAVSLLQRFYDPDSGTITLDGIDIKKLQLKWLRQQMGLVSQEAVLFNGTIRENIAYGKEGKATEAEILAAAELANAHNFTSGMQQGYDTIVGERGVQLSGGQKQRVAIARAIVKNPKVLLLDEPSSALDAESERIVQEALERIMVNRSTVVVAHRLSTVKNADLIAVVKNGVIAENGNHDALININQGIYATLVALHNHNKLNNDES